MICLVSLCFDPRPTSLTVSHGSSSADFDGDWSGGRTTGAEIGGVTIDAVDWVLSKGLSLFDGDMTGFDGDWSEGPEAFPSKTGAETGGVPIGSLSLFDGGLTGVSLFDGGLTGGVLSSRLVDGELASDAMDWVVSKGLCPFDSEKTVKRSI